MRRIAMVISILVLFALLIPFPARMKDGGTVHYNAVLYDVYDVHRLNPADTIPDDEAYDVEYIEGIIIKILGFEVFNNTDPHIDN